MLLLDSQALCPPVCCYFCITSVVLYLYGSMRPVGSTSRLLDMLPSKPIVVTVDTGTACVLLSQKYFGILCTACMHRFC